MAPSVAREGRPLVPTEDRAGDVPGRGGPDDENAGGRRRGRRPPARLAPQRLAEARGGAREGLDWLGREPEIRAGLALRALTSLGRFVFFRVLRFRVEHEVVPGPSGTAAPTGGYLLVAAIHRGWMDPFLILDALPIEPRVWFLGSGPSAFDRRWKEWLLRRIGGIVPVWRGGIGIETHVAAARAVLGRGGVFVLVPEGGVGGPPDRLAPFRLGTAIIALRTGAPIVPFAMVGGEELYLGKRFATRRLPPTSARRLLEGDWDGTPPTEGSRDELALAQRLTDRLAALLDPEVEALHPRTVDPPERPRRLRRLTWLLLSRPARSGGRGSDSTD